MKKDEGKKGKKRKVPKQTAPQLSEEQKQGLLELA